jgi:hypothetical protein
MPAAAMVVWAVAQFSVMIDRNLANDVDVGGISSLATGSLQQKEV